MRPASPRRGSISSGWRRTATTWCRVTTIRRASLRYEERGVTVFKDSGRIDGPGRVVVNGRVLETGGDHRRHRRRRGRASDPRPGRGGLLDESGGDRPHRDPGERRRRRRGSRGHRAGPVHGPLRDPGHARPGPAEACRPGGTGDRGCSGRDPRRRRHRAAARRPRPVRAARGRGASRLARRRHRGPRRSRCSSRPAGGHGRRASVSRRSGSSPGKRGIQIDERCRAGEGRVGDRRRHRSRSVHARRQVPGPYRGRGHPRPGGEGRLSRGAAGHLHRSRGRGRRA